MQSNTGGWEAYSVGIICALAVEKAAVEATLDDEHPRVRNATGDENDYAFGRIGDHNVVVACLPAGIMGLVSAATVAKDMMRSFPIKIGLMVGICGGVWSEETDVRIGDVIVSQPTGQHGGVVQYDFGKVKAGGIWQRTGSLNKPPKVLLGAMQTLKARHERYGDELEKYLQEMWSKYPRMNAKYGYQGRDQDRLFEASYDHAEGGSCDQCDNARLQRRQEREEEAPKIHYGNIASGDAVIEDALIRDEIATAEGVLCFEMEAAGLMDSFPCVVVRGVCDYADSHKNKRWQPYAAATAACYAKELLSIIDVHGVHELKPIGE